MPSNSHEETTAKILFSGAIFMLVAAIVVLLIDQQIKKDILRRTRDAYDAIHRGQDIVSKMDRAAAKLESERSEAAEPPKWNRVHQPTGQWRSGPGTRHDYTYNTVDGGYPTFTAKPAEKVYDHQEEDTTHERPEEDDSHGADRARDSSRDADSGTP